MQNISKEDFGQANAIAGQLETHIEPNFDHFLNFIYDYPALTNEMGGVVLAAESSIEEIQRFLEGYLRANLEARQRSIEWKEIGTVADPAVDVVLQVLGKHDGKDLRLMQDYHRYSMVAENKIGQLLEAYLAMKLEPLGWFWCSCDVLKGVDFFKGGDPVTLLQVKNRSNSENSSSSKIRDFLVAQGCPVKIKKWYRSNSSTGQTRWEKLEGNGVDYFANEEGFFEFIRTYRVD